MNHYFDQSEAASGLPTAVTSAGYKTGYETGYETYPINTRADLSWPETPYEASHVSKGQR